MSKRTPHSPDADLDARETEILKSIIRAHIVTGEPVGSRAVSELPRLDLSPATIRSVMAELEERGLLIQPHTSAGRVPTDDAYRFYVRRLMGRTRVGAAKAQVIDDALLRSRGEITDLLGEASRQLSRFSRNVGVVMAPAAQRIVVERMEFVRLNDRRVVAVVVGRSGVVHNRILQLDEPVGQEELDKVGRYLTDEFHGLSLPQIREELLRRVSEAQAEYHRLVDRGLELGRKAVELEEEEASVFVEGTANLLNSPEFSDLDRLRELVRTLETRERLVRLLSRVLEEDGVQVIIGDEGLDPGLSRCSVVASNYRSGDQIMGSVGIVGPTRMEYVQAVALVDHLARVLTRLLTHSEAENAGS